MSYYGNGEREREREMFSGNDAVGEIPWAPLSDGSVQAWGLIKAHMMMDTSRKPVGFNLFLLLHPGVQ